MVGKEEGQSSLLSLISPKMHDSEAVIKFQKVPVDLKMKKQILGIGFAYKGPVFDNPMLLD